MIKIVTPGKNWFSVSCSKCGCEFEYECVDIDVSGFVTCPTCGNKIKHSLQSDIGEDIDTSKAYDKACLSCEFYRKHIASGESYFGDVPCQWCKHYPWKIGWSSCSSINLTKYSNKD